MKNIKKMILICIMIIILLSLCSFMFFKYNQCRILKNIVKNVDLIMENGNFYYEVKTSDDTTNTKIWAKDNCIKVDNTSSLYYVDINNNKTYYIDETNKIYREQDMCLMVKPIFINFSETLSFLRNNFDTLNIMFSIKKFETESINGVEFYKIRYEDNKNQLIEEVIFVNKETLLPVRSENITRVSNYTIELNKVTDKDVKFENRDQYELFE